MKQYRAWGEYGPTAGDLIEVPIFQAANDKEAFAHAVSELKKAREWKRIGNHNVHIQEYYPPVGC